LRANIKLCLGEDTRAIEEALQAEVNQPAPERGRVKVARDGECLILRIEARDLSSLRALTSSYLYLIHAAYSALARSGTKR